MVRLRDDPGYCTAPEWFRDLETIHRKRIVLWQIRFAASAASTDHAEAKSSDLDRATFSMRVKNAKPTVYFQRDGHAAIYLAPSNEIS
jgi:hypothetical protein